MASWQAYVASWILKRGLKPRLRAARDIFESRRLLKPPPYRVPRDVRIAAREFGGVRGEWLECGSGNGLVLLYLHGGGYFACSPETHRPITAGFARQGFRVFAPDYRLAPEHHFPAAVDDAVAVYRGVLAEHIQASDVVVAGESAGGGLALALMVASRDAGVPLPAAAALFSPWTDLAGTGESLRANARRCAMFAGGPGIQQAAGAYLNGADPCHPLASPLYADLRGLPPLLIHVGKNEVLLDDSVRLADRARASGVRVELKVWTAVPHAWQLAQSTIPEARQSLQEAGAFLQQVAAHHASSNAR
ncbi:MAG: alpha/beta hydrolase [Terriglobia bacterium]|nr:MAG: alpha/beta hydrolase [Terriglobia bacterium]